MFTGYAGVKDGLLTPAAHMYRFGYSSLLVDFRGSGGSSRNDTTLGVREAKDVAAAYRYVKREWPKQPIVLYGVSMGAAAIFRAFALEDMRPAAIIAEGTFDRLLTTARHRFDALGLPSFPAAELLVFWGSVQIGYNGFNHNPVDYAADIACPTLLMHGERDPWITGAETTAILDRLQGPKQMIDFAGLGHEMPFVYGAPDLWVETVGQFLARLPPA
jgi:alpha-beta hydrolase superfamily lysophospholipase